MMQTGKVICSHQLLHVTSVGSCISSHGTTGKHPATSSGGSVGCILFQPADQMFRPRAPEALGGSIAQADTLTIHASEATESLLLRRHCCTKIWQLPAPSYQLPASEAWNRPAVVSKHTYPR